MDRVKCAVFKVKSDHIKQRKLWFYWFKRGVNRRCVGAEVNSFTCLSITAAMIPSVHFHASFS